MADRDKGRFKEELKASFGEIIKYQATKQKYELFEVYIESPRIIVERVSPDSLTDEENLYRSYDIQFYLDDISIFSFLEAEITEMLLEEESLNLCSIDSMFQQNIPQTSELLEYSFKIQEGDYVIDSLYYSTNSNTKLSDTTRGVYITLPLGRSG
ncbi:MAG: hypothetical protein GX154_04205, partial [Clostridiales bacterium]|nr:hypothetical protein [Clostridiales bacterium]